LTATGKHQEENVLYTDF